MSYRTKKTNIAHSNICLVQTDPKCLLGRAKNDAWRMWLLNVCWGLIYVFETKIMCDSGLYMIISPRFKIKFQNLKIKKVFSYRLDGCNFLIKICIIPLTVFLNPEHLSLAPLLPSTKLRNLLARNSSP